MFSFNNNNNNKSESLDSILGVFNNTLDKLISFISNKKDANAEIKEKVKVLEAEEEANVADITRAEYTVSELKKILNK